MAYKKASQNALAETNDPPSSGVQVLRLALLEDGGFGQ